MFGQTTHMQKTLVDAYHTVLLRMREKNLVLPMAMILALCGAVVPRALASPINYQNAGTQTIGTVIADDATPTSLTQAGTGTTILTARNTYTGTTTISAGTLKVGNGGTIGTLGTGNVVNNAALVFNRSDTPTLSNAISGTGSLTQAGPGTLFVTGDNTYTGTTTVASGTLRVGIGGASGSLGAGNIILQNHGVLAFQRSDSMTVSQAISGTGDVSQLGAGTTILAGANTYYGTTTVSSGTLQIGNAGTAGKISSGAIINNAVLAFNRSDSVIVSNAISGTGSVRNTGTGVTTLSYANTYTGTTQVLSGIFKAGRADNAFGNNSAVIVNGTLNLGGFSQTIGSLSGSGTIVGGAGVLITLTIGGNNTDSSLTGNIQNGGLTGLTEVSVVKVGSGTQTFAGTSATYTGTTTIAGGTLRIGNGGASGTLGRGQVIIGSGTLAFYRKNAMTLSNSIGGSGAVSQIGTGVTTLTGGNSYTGATTISAGRLNLAGSNVGGGALTNNATLGLTGGATHEGTITNNNLSFMYVTGTVTTGALSFANGSTLVLANGSTLVNAGAVTVTAGAQIAATSATGFTAGTQKRVIDGTSASGVFTVNTALSASAGVGYHWVSTTVGTDVFLGTQLDAPLLAGGTTQQNSTLSALENAGAAIAVNPDIQANIAYLAGLSGPALKDALNRQSGHDRSTQDAMLGQHAMGRGQAMQQLAANLDADTHGSAQASTADGALRASALDGVQSGKVKEGGDLSFFVQATRGSERRNQQTSGALGSTATGSVFSVGVCDQLTDSVNVGAAFTFDMTDIKSGGGLGKSDNRTYGLDLFASHTLDAAKRWYVAGDIGMGILRADNTRYGVGAGGLTATSNTQGVETHLSGEIGCKVDAWANAVLTPHAGLSYVYHTIDASQESLPGAPGMALNYAAKHEQLLQSVVGADLAQSFDIGGGNTLTPSIGVSWIHQLDSADNRLATSFAGSPTAGFITRLADVAKDAVEVSAGLSLKLGSHLSASVTAKTTQSLDSDAKGHQNSMGASLKYDF